MNADETAPSPTSRPPRRSRSGRGAWLHRVSAAVVFAACVTSATSVSQHLARARVHAGTAIPGRMVDLGGFRIHMLEAGHAHRGGGPTVVLEPGGSGTAATWQHVVREVGEHAYVIAYDLAGHGFSDDHREVRDNTRVAIDLYGMLKADGVPGPYILVGHSLGGAYVRTFASLYPEEVGGMVLVDSSHSDQVERSFRRKVPVRILDSGDRLSSMLDSDHARVLSAVVLEVVDAARVARAEA